MDITKILFVLLTLFHNVISRYMKQESNDLSLERSFCAFSIDCKNPNDYCDAETHRCTPKNKNVFKRSLKGLNEYCTQVAECADTLVCDNLTRKCVEATNTEQVIKKQKKHCKVNSDCPCNEAKMVCEDRECVTAKKPTFKIRSPVGGPCDEKDDCLKGFCLRETCINPTTMEDLYLFYQMKGGEIKKCQVDSDCPSNNECRSGFCLLPKKSGGKKIKRKCRGNNCSQRYLS